MSGTDITSFLEGSSIWPFLFSLMTLSPGFLILRIRSFFVTGKTKAISEAIAEYAISSSVYYSISLPVFYNYGDYGWLWLSGLFLWAPILLGLLGGYIYQQNLARKALSKMWLNPVHPAPTSWDFLFGSLRAGSWVVVTLKNYEQIFGYFGENSLAASDLSRRDLFIEDIRSSSWEVLETDGRQRGIWLSEEEIVMIEIITDGVACE